jgi:hypothetical protein
VELDSRRRCRSRAAQNRGALPRSGTLERCLACEAVVKQGHRSPNALPVLRSVV